MFGFKQISPATDSFIWKALTKSLAIWAKTSAKETTSDGFQHPFAWLSRANVFPNCCRKLLWPRISSKQVYSQKQIVTVLLHWKAKIMLFPTNLPLEMIVRFISLTSKEGKLFSFQWIISNLLSRLNYAGWIFAMRIPSSVYTLNTSLLRKLMFFFFFSSRQFSGERILWWQ